MRFLNKCFVVYREIVKLSSYSTEPIPSSNIKNNRSNLYKRKDFNIEPFKKMKANLSSGLIANYLDQKEYLDSQVPIYQNSDL